VAEITRKRTGELIRTLFEILMKSPEGLPAAQALEILASKVMLTPYESGTYESSGGRRFEKIVRFATVDCVKAGWLLKQKGIWTVTELGAAAHKSIADPEAFYREAVRLYREWRVAHPAQDQAASHDAPAEGADAEKSASITFEEAEEQASGEIQQFLNAMQPYEFQELVADLLRAMGYYPSWIAPPGKDGGVDIVAHTDPLGLHSPRIKVQVKRKSAEKVSADGLKSFIANLGDDDVGIYVTLAGYTRDAGEFARSQERRKITLIDRDQLVELWIKFSGKLDERAKQRFRLSPIYFLTPID
jgi:restriction system protein